MARYAFVSPSVGWSIVADNESASRFWVLETRDGAHHWQQRLTAACATSVGPAPAIRFFDAAHGIVLACDPGVLFRTADAGASWSLVQLPSYAAPVVSFVDTQSGWVFGTTVAGDQETYHLAATTDGGVRWSELPVPVGSAPSGSAVIFDVVFQNRLNGWLAACLDQPGVYATVDGGMTWTVRSLPFAAVQPLTGGCAQVELIPGRGVLATVFDSNGGEFGFTSFDGGASWRELAPPPGNATFDDYAFVDATHWWAAPYGELYKSADAGRTWIRTAQKLDELIYHVSIVDTMHAWAVLSPTAGAIPPINDLGEGLATTADGGLHWTYVAVPNPGLS